MTLASLLALRAVIGFLVCALMTHVDHTCEVHMEPVRLGEAKEGAQASESSGLPGFESFSLWGA